MGGLISLYSFFRAPETFGFYGRHEPVVVAGDRVPIDYVERNGTPAGRPSTPEPTKAPEP
jgi:hypothetical protein